MHINDVPANQRHNNYSVIGTFFTKPEEWELAPPTDSTASLIREEARKTRRPIAPDDSKYEEGILIMPSSRLLPILRALNQEISGAIYSLTVSPQMKRMDIARKKKMKALEIAGMEITHRKIDDDNIELRVIIGKGMRDIVAAHILQQESWHLKQ